MNGIKTSSNGSITMKTLYDAISQTNDNVVEAGKDIAKMKEHNKSQDDICQLHRAGVEERVDAFEEGVCTDITEIKNAIKPLTGFRAKVIMIPGMLMGMFGLVIAILKILDWLHTLTEG